MTVREHLKAVHTRAAEHHIARSKFHKTMAAHHRTLAEFHKADMEGEDQNHPTAVHAGIAEQHDGMASEHADHAAFHVQCCKDLSASTKAAMGGDDALVPSEVSAVTPTAPGIRAVPRAGQRQTDDVPTVDAAFAHLVKVEDD